jgi:hypothetical protein
MATAYSILQADSLDAAVQRAKGCPQMQSSGQISVYETFPVMVARPSEKQPKQRPPWSHRLPEVFVVLTP